MRVLFFVDWTVGYLLHQQADGVVVIGDVAIGSIHAVDRGCEVTGVVVHEADQGQTGETARRVIGVEVTFPLLEAVIIREGGIEAAEVRVGIGRERDIRGRGDDGFSRERIVGERRLATGFVIAVGIDEETIGANGESRAKRVVPQIAGVHFIVRSIRGGNVSLTRKQILAVLGIGAISSAGHEWIGSLALGQGGQGNVDIAIEALRVEAESPLRVVDRELVLDDIRCAGGGAPRPAVVAGFSAGAEVIECDEGLRQVMLIRRNRLSEQSHRRIAVAAAEVAENLVVGSVLLEDIDHVLDALLHGGQNGAGGGGGAEAVIALYLLRQLWKRRHGACYREAQQAGFGQLRIVLIGRHAGGITLGSVDVAPVRIGPGRRLRIDDVGPAAIGAEADRVGIPAGRDESRDVVAGIGFAQRYHSNVVQIAVGHEELCFIR